MQTPVVERLGMSRAIVLERPAMGGGRTVWYLCSDQARLGAVEAALLPGSRVSFYFDDRFKDVEYSPQVEVEALEIIERTTEVTIGTLADDKLQIEMTILSGPGDLAVYSSETPFGTRVFYGEIPDAGMMESTQ